MTQIAEAYFHLSPFGLRPNQLQTLGRRADDLAHEVASDVFRAGVELSVTLEPGSLKGWVTAIAAGVVTTYGMVAAYPDLKAGLVEVSRDARHFAGEFNNKFFEDSSVKPEQVYRAERRTKTPGKLLRALEQLEELERNIGKMDTNDARIEFYRIRKNLVAAIADFPKDERVSMAEVIEREHQPRLPKRVVPLVGLRPREDEFQFDLPVHRLDVSSMGPRSLSYHNTFMIPGSRPPPDYPRPQIGR